MTAFHGSRLGVVVALVVLGPLFGHVSRAGAAFPGAVGKIAFVSDRDGNKEIYVMNANGSGQTRVTNNPADDLGPATSPNGAKIAFTSTRNGNDEIYVMNADGSGLVRLTNNSGDDRDPAWSPDGTKITFDSDRNGTTEIYVMNADGSGQTRLTNNADGAFTPAWSPDGTKIAFATFGTGNAVIFVMKANGSGQTQVTSAGLGCCFGDEDPNWSPDGKKIVFDSNRDSALGDREIYVVNAGGPGLDAGLTRLTNNFGDDGEPAWSPDGTKIAFDSGRNGLTEVFVMNPDGSGQTPRTNSPGDDSDPDWAPLGKANLAVSLAHGTFNPATRRLTWTITVPNAGPAPADGVVLSDAIGGTTFVSASSSKGSCTGPAVGSTGTVTCSLGTVSPGASQTAQVVVKVPATTASFSDTATVTTASSDPNTANNAASATVTLPTADLALTVVATPDPVAPNQQLTYAMTVTNKGPDTAAGIVLNDIVSGQAGFIGIAGIPSTACAPVPAVGSTGLVSCSLGSLASGASISMRLLVNSGGSSPNTLSNTSSTRSLTTDPITTNNSITQGIQVSSVGTFRLKPTRTTAHPGSTVHLHITWITPRRWRDLRTVELKLLDGRRVAGRVRFRNDGSKTGRLSLGARSGKPGAHRVLRSGALSLLLAQCHVHTSGPTGRTVTIDLALRVGHRLTGHTLTLKVGATDRNGTKQPFRRAGSLAIRR
jgi:TolB protein